MTLYASTSNIDGIFTIHEKNHVFEKKLIARHVYYTLYIGGYYKKNAEKMELKSKYIWHKIFEIHAFFFSIISIFRGLP